MLDPIRYRSAPMTAGFDSLDSLPRVGGTSAGSYVRIAPQVLVAVPNPGYIQTASGAAASLAELDRIARENNARQAVIIVVDRVASQDAASRRVWSANRPNETRCAQALVCSSRLARAIGSFFLGLNRGPVPTRMFETIDEAVSWCTSIVESDDGLPS